MEYTNQLSNNYASRLQSQYNDINDNINRLINDLGDKVEKQLVAIEERALWNYKEDLLKTQNSFKELKQTRNDEAIKQNILSMKLQQEKLYQQSTEKSLEMNKIYERLKTEFKKTVQYSHQLELELTFLGKQCKIAKTKSQALDQEIAQYEERRNKGAISLLQRTQSSKTLEKKHSKTEEAAIIQIDQTLYERRLREQIEQIKEFNSLIGEEKTTLEMIFSKHDISSLQTQREKSALFYRIFEDKEFKRYIYKVLFSKRDQLLKKKRGQ